MDLLSLGKIIDSFGLDGSLKVYSTTNYGKERYKTNSHLFLISPDEKESIEVTVKSYSKNGMIDRVSFNEINNPEDAKKYKGYFIKINKNDANIPEKHYFYSDLVNCNVIDQDGKCIGKVIKVEEFPAQITLRCKGVKNFFVPFLKQFIKKVDIEKKEIYIEVIEGML